MVFFGHYRFFNRLMTAHQLAEMRINRHGTAPYGSQRRNCDTTSEPRKRQNGAFAFKLSGPPVTLRKIFHGAIVIPKGDSTSGETRVNTCSPTRAPCARQTARS